MDKWKIMEFYGNGDSHFGGNADDRVLGNGENFLKNPIKSRKDIMLFNSINEAQESIAKIKNKREGGIISIILHR